METKTNKMLRIGNEGKTAFQIFNDQTGEGYSCFEYKGHWEIVRIKRVQRGWGFNTSYVWKANWLNEDRHEFCTKAEMMDYIYKNL